MAEALPEDKARTVAVKRVAWAFIVLVDDVRMSASGQVWPRRARWRRAAASAVAC